mmetsp:Transcript_20862/g.45209  ORF Transcript_20862/g.45209 Transcript_20862/m.45209 type:complete len:81 (+) Transcript_20862:108-350(+)
MKQYKHFGWYLVNVCCNLHLHEVYLEEPNKDCAYLHAAACCDLRLDPKKARSENGKTALCRLGGEQNDPGCSEVINSENP